MFFASDLAPASPFFKCAVIQNNMEFVERHWRWLRGTGPGTLQRDASQGSGRGGTGEGQRKHLSGSVVNQVGISMPLKLFVVELSKFHNFLTRPCGRDTHAAAFKTTE